MNYAISSLDYLVPPGLSGQFAKFLPTLILVDMTFDLALSLKSIEILLGSISVTCVHSSAFKL